MVSCFQPCSAELCSRSRRIPGPGQDGLTHGLVRPLAGSVRLRGLGPGGNQSKIEPILNNTSFRSSERTIILQLHLTDHMYFIQ